MHFHTAAYCILNHFNLSPSLETPRLQELKVFPPPLADICLLSCFCSPKTLDAGQRDTELHSPRSRVAGDPWPGQGPGMLWGNQFGLPGQWGQTQMWYLCSLCQSCSSPSTSCTLAHPGANEQGQQLLSPGLRRSLQPHSAQLCQGEATGLADTILPPGTAFPAIPAAWVPSDHHFPTAPCSTWEAGMVPQGLWSHGWDLLPQGTQCSKCSALCPNHWWTSGLGCATDEGSQLGFTVPAVGKEQERWKMDILFL